VIRDHSPANGPAVESALCQKFAEESRSIGESCKDTKVLSESSIAASSVQGPAFSGEGNDSLDLVGSELLESCDSFRQFWILMAGQITALFGKISSLW
jgi:hypothetical protein